MQCVILLIGFLFLLFLIGLGIETFHGKIDISNLKPGDFLAIWTLQVTFSTILLAVSGFLINFFNEKVLGIPFSEITKKKRIWNCFLYVVISIILPIIIYISLLFIFNGNDNKDSSDLSKFLFILMLTIVTGGLILNYIFVCKVLGLILNKEKLKEEIKKAIENTINEELKSSQTGGK